MNQDLRFRLPANPNTNMFGNPIPLCVPGLIPDRYTISVMSYRGTAEARLLALMPVQRNLPLRIGSNGQPLQGTQHLLYWQNLLPHQISDIDSARLVAAMVQCVGHFESPACSNCAGGGYGAFVGCARARGRSGVGSQDLFLLGACANHFFFRHGTRCRFRRADDDDSGKGGRDPGPRKDGNGGGSGAGPAGPAGPSAGMIATS